MFMLNNCNCLVRRKNMKSIKDIAWNVTEPEYRADPAISYSALSRFEREGWRKMSSLYDKIETPSLQFGSAVDTMLTDGQEAFNEQFVVCEFPSLSDSLISITKELHRRFKDTYRKVSSIPDAAIDSVALMNNYYTNPKYAAYRVKNVKESCDEYYNLLTLAEGKTVLSTSDYEDIMRCVDELRSNKVTSYFFSENPFVTHIEKVFQLKFKAEYKGIPVRCMFDEIIVDHNSKTIYPIDLKTTGHPEEEFNGSFSQWRYDIQAKLYTYILQQNIKKDEYFKDFKIAYYYQFIVINRRTLSPIVWEFDGSLSEIDFIDDKGNVLRDWRKILLDLKYYQENTSKYSREVQENDCRMRIKLKRC